MVEAAANPGPAAARSPVGNVAGLVAERLAAAGVSHLFGMPGGGSSVELIDAWAGSGRPFVLAHTETAGAFMAAAQAELGERLGACLATLGPGAASVVNGVAHAFLDRVPLVVLTERHPDAVGDVAPHQTIDQRGMFGSLAKSSTGLTAAGAAGEIDRAIALALAAPAGPVHLDWPPDVATAQATGTERATDGAGAGAPASIEGDLERIARRARRPLLLIGLGARADADARAIRAFCERRAVPALVTYKAKGVVPDEHPAFAGVLTHGALERPVLERADLLIGVGLDPVELLPRPWSYARPFVACSPPAIAQRQIPVAATVHGDVPAALGILDALLPSPEWDLDEIGALAASQRANMRAGGGTDGVAPDAVVDAASAAFGADRQLCVDAGAHMFPAMALWPATRPRQIAISNGLSTMGFSVPAAIGIELLRPGARTVAFIGDGGLLMCLGELRTAAAERVPIRIVVFDDAALSLIRIKQLARGIAPHATGIDRVGWRAVAEGLGVAAFGADTRDGLEGALAEADAVDGPALVAVRVDPDPYRRMIVALRG